MVDKRSRKHPFFRRFLVLFVLTTFIPVNSVSLYAQSSSGSIPHHGISQADPMALIGSLKLPEELGIIQETYVPDVPPRQLVVYIQNAHTNYDSEVSTRSLIEYFQKNYGLSLVLLEGGEGRLDSLFF